MAKGHKTGGRTRGIPNKRTQAREMLAEIMRSPDGRQLLAPVLQQMQQPPKGTKKATEVLHELMMLSMNCVAINQPKPGPEGPLVIADDEKLTNYLKIAVSAAGELARYQSPTFKAIALQEVPAPVGGEEPGEGAKVIGLLGKRSQNDAANAYLRLVRKDPKAA